MKTKQILLTSLASLTLVATTAFALTPQDDSSQWIQKRVAKRAIARIEQRLNITDAQREQAKAILKNEQPTIVSLAGQAKQERDELAQMPSFNDAQVREIAQKYAATNADILVERAKVRMQLRAILTDAQRQQLAQMRARVGSHLDERLDGLIDAI